jgi:hypothetical protein
MFKKILKRIILFILVFLLLFAGYLFIGSPPQVEKITWGVNFSQKHAQNLGLDWKETYLALLDDLRVKNLKVSAHWDLIEPEKDKYNFQDLDWQIKEAEKREAKILLVMGMKTGRWPECHIPNWAKDLTEKMQKKEILELLEIIVLKYRGQSTVNFWQVENEPFFSFGECPPLDINFLKKEIDLVKSLDSSRPIIISDSGEFSFWIKAAKLADIVGTTLYRRVWVKELKIYFTHHWFRPIYYWRKSEIIKKLFGKKVICVELQAEPWGPKLLYELPYKEQKLTMNLKQFRENIEFAKKTGLDKFYLWGAEWWYWLKEKHNQPEIWNEAKKLMIYDL